MKERDGDYDLLDVIFSILEYPMDFYFHNDEIVEQILGETIESYSEERREDGRK